MDGNVRKKRSRRKDFAWEKSICPARGGGRCENRGDFGRKMKKEAIATFKAFLVELAVYAALVTGYFFLVLHFLGGWLYRLEMHHRYTYAIVAIGLIIGQAVVLEAVTTMLLRMLRGRSE